MMEAFEIMLPAMFPRVATPVRKHVMRPKKTPQLACFARCKTILKFFKMVEKRLKDI
jgi:hypothetical protein